MLRHQRLQPVPLLVGGGEQFIGLGRGAEKALNCWKILVSPVIAEDIADHGHLALGAKFPNHILKAD